MAAIGFIIVNGISRKAYDVNIESTPVEGVDTKKDAVAESFAFFLFNSKAAGITPQEQIGNGPLLKLL